MPVSERLAGVSVTTITWRSRHMILTTSDKETPTPTPRPAPTHDSRLPIYRARLPPPPTLPSPPPPAQHPLGHLPSARLSNCLVTLVCVSVRAVNLTDRRPSMPTNLRRRCRRTSDGSTTATAQPRRRCAWIRRSPPAVATTNLSNYRLHERCYGGHVSARWSMDAGPGHVDFFRIETWNSSPVADY